MVIGSHRPAGQRYFAASGDLASQGSRLSQELSSAPFTQAHHGEPRRRSVLYVKWSNTGAASSFLLLFFTELTRAKQANFSMHNTHLQQACAKYPARDPHEHALASVYAGRIALHRSADETQAGGDNGIANVPQNYLSSAWRSSLTSMNRVRGQCMIPSRHRETH